METCRLPLMRQIGHVCQLIPVGLEQVPIPAQLDSQFGEIPKHSSRHHAVAKARQHRLVELR
jgi:hypothetical protein